jgi:ribonuclease BN (tRNA processing enzyme)
VRTTIVGWSGSFPGPESPASCYLIDTGDFRLVLDMGSGAVGALQRHCALTDVDAICLSHLHSDHCLDMCGYSVAQAHHPDGPRPPIPVYGPAHTADRLARAHAAAYGAGSGTGITEAFDFTTLTPGVIEIGPLRITAARMNHPVETFGFRIEHGGTVLAYSADTGPCAELVRLADAADVLLCEASFLEGQQEGRPGEHLTARQAAEHAGRAGVGELVLTHLVPWNDRAATLEQAAPAFDGTLTLASSARQLPGGG